MTAEQFDVILEARIASIRDVLVAKAKEYADDGDRLHNFKESARLFGGTPQEALWGFLVKHLTSVRDIAVGIRPVSIDTIREKIGDAVNYLILMEALLSETHG